MLNTSTGPRAPPIGSPARAFPLHPAQALTPCTRPKALRLWTPGKVLPCIRAGVVTLHLTRGISSPAPEQGPSPCIPRRRSALHPDTKNGIVLIPPFCVFARPDAASVSPSAAQSAQETIGNVEIFIRDFFFSDVFRRNADRLDRQPAQRF